MSDWAKCSKAMLLIKLKPGVSGQAFNAFFADVRWGENAVSGEVSATKAVLMDKSKIDHLPHQILMADSPPPYDAAYQLRSHATGQEDAFEPAIADIVEQLDEWLDRSRSALLVGTEVTITRGWGPIEIIMPLRRRPELNHDQFMESWYGRHASIGEAVEGVRYRQNHVDAEATEHLAKTTGIGSGALDGVTESFFLTPEEAISVMSRPEVAIEAIDDEKEFIDHARSQFGFYHILK